MIAKALISSSYKCPYFNKIHKKTLFFDNLFQQALLACKKKVIYIDTQFLEQHSNTTTKQKIVLNNFASIEFSITTISNHDIQQINNKYRGFNKATNVLSFENSFTQNKVLYLGDMYIAPQVIMQEAGEQNKQIQDHYIHIILHGFLHLLGYDHQDESNAKTMESLEVKILKQFGITNPYI